MSAEHESPVCFPPGWGKSQAFAKSLPLVPIVRVWCEAWGLEDFWAREGRVDVFQTTHEMTGPVEGRVVVWWREQLACGHIRHQGGPALKLGKRRCEQCGPKEKL